MGREENKVWKQKRMSVHLCKFIKFIKNQRKPRIENKD